MGRVLEEVVTEVGVDIGRVLEEVVITEVGVDIGSVLEVVVVIIIVEGSVFISVSIDSSS